ncbi:hypothetical protein LUQ84_001379 [Hamiltosporidium tvaerminnensis]|nr:hypothetical protein LUQ84_001379 [Hamiltosporidium tvaerminnensis]
MEKYKNKLKKCIFIEIKGYISIYLSKDKEMKNIGYFKEMFKNVMGYSLYVCGSKRIKIFKGIFEIIMMNVYKCMEGYKGITNEQQGVSDKSNELEGVSDKSNELEGYSNSSSILEGYSNSSRILEGYGNSCSNELQGFSNSSSIL